MALCSEACGAGSGEEPSSGQGGPSCLHFGVRSYLHHFYEECSSSIRDPEEQRSTRWSAVWKVSLALGLLILTAGIASLSAGYSTPPKIESFGEGDLFFVDTHAIRFNRGLHLTTAAGIGLSCLGSALAAMGAVVWILPRARLKEKLVRRPADGERRGERVSKCKGFRHRGEVVTKAPCVKEGSSTAVPLTKVQDMQPAS